MDVKTTWDRHGGIRVEPELKAPRTRLRTVLSEWKRIPQALSMLDSAESVKQTGGAVEISGVRIEPCDEYGQTHTTAHRDQLRDALLQIYKDASPLRQEPQFCTCPNPPYPHVHEAE